MRWSLVPLLAVLFLLTGCSALWGGSASSSSSASEPEGTAAHALASVRGSIPAVEAWYADHGTYAGLTLQDLQQQYDAEIKDVRFVGRLNRKTYCVESTVGEIAYHKQGPGSDILLGRCGTDGRPVTPPPPPSYDSQTNLRTAIPAIEAWHADHGTYAAMTLKKLRAQYDYGIPLEVEVVRATRKAYCIESTVAGETWSYVGPVRGLVRGSC
jgi:hypothetical protein